MKFVAKSLLLVVAFIGIGVLVACGIALATGAILISRGINSLSDLVQIPAWARSLVFWSAIIPAASVILGLFSPFARSRRRSSIVLTIVTVLYWTAVAGLNHYRRFDPVSGTPRKWYYVDHSGVHWSNHPGFDPANGEKYLPATMDRVERLSVPVVEVDPRTNQWFSASDGAPLLFFVQSGSNHWRFFKGPSRGGYDPESGIALRPVDPQMRRQWEHELRNDDAGTGATSRAEQERRLQLLRNQATGKNQVSEPTISALSRQVNVLATKLQQTETTVLEFKTAAQRAERNKEHYAEEANQHRAQSEEFKNQILQFRTVAERAEAELAHYKTAAEQHTAETQEHEEQIQILKAAIDQLNQQPKPAENTQSTTMVDTHVSFVTPATQLSIPTQSYQSPVYVTPRVTYYWPAQARPVYYTYPPRTFYYRRH